MSQDITPFDAEILETEQLQTAGWRQVVNSSCHDC